MHLKLSICDAGFVNLKYSVTVPFKSPPNQSTTTHQYDIIIDKVPIEMTVRKLGRKAHGARISFNWGNPLKAIPGKPSICSNRVDKMHWIFALGRGKSSD